MTAAIIAVLAVLLLFIPIQIIIARGFYSCAQSQAHDLAAVSRQKKFLTWILTIGFLSWVVALIALPNKEDVAVVGGGTLLLVGSAASLPILAQMGRISRTPYVVARIALVPIVGGLLILVGELLN